LKGTRPTDFLGFATTEGVAEGQAFEPGMLLYEGTDVLQSPTGPTGPTAEEIAAQQAAEEAAAQAAAEEAARIEAERAAAEEAARIAAAQEAQRLEQERLAAEQLAAEQAAAEQAAAEQAAAQQAAAEQLAAEQLAAQEAAEAARQQELLAQQEAQRIAQEQFDAQVAAEQAAAQQTAAEVLAQEQAAAQAAQTQTQDARVESASDKIQEATQKQAVADVANQNLAQATNQGADSATIETLTLDATLKQQDADAAALEAELAVAPDPTPVYEAPTQGELLQAAADADTGPLFTTPTDLGTVIPRSTLGLVPQTTGIMSFLGQPNFNVADTITDYTSGYPSSQDMQFRRTFYPFQQVTEEEAQNQYMADIFKPVADMSQFRPALTFGERAQTTATGSGVGFQEDVPVGNVNTGAAASAPGQY
jgi:DNA polymerase III alpha subunit (gram-positive type)